MSIRGDPLGSDPWQYLSQSEILYGKAKENAEEIKKIQGSLGSSTESATNPEDVLKKPTEDG